MILCLTCRGWQGLSIEVEIIKIDGLLQKTHHLGRSVLRGELKIPFKLFYRVHILVTVKYLTINLLYNVNRYESGNKVQANLLNNQRTKRLS